MAEETEITASINLAELIPFDKILEVLNGPVSDLVSLPSLPQPFSTSSLPQNPKTPKPQNPKHMK